MVLRRLLMTAVLGLGLSAAPAISAPSDEGAFPKGMDCPAGHQPYSVNTVLLDIYINPQTRGIVEQEAPGFFASLPRRFARTEPPTFMDIATLGQANHQVPADKVIPADALARIDAELAQVPVTEDAIKARCARYDETPPVLPLRVHQPAILVFDKINGFRDDPSVNAATAALKAMAAREGWTLVFTDNGAVFNARDLRHFKAVIWNNVSGDVLTLPQREAFKTYIAHGGGFAGIHGAGGDPYYDWDWYVDTLIGARFLGHPGSPQFQPARVIIDDPSSAITRGLGDWTMTEEWYSFKSDPRHDGVHVLARLDETTYAPNEAGHDISMGADHPIAWTRCLGDGRSFFTAIGHRPESYSEPNSIALLEKGIAWSAGLGETQCLAGHETALQP